MTSPVRRQDARTHAVTMRCALPSRPPHQSPSAARLHPRRAAHAASRRTQLSDSCTQPQARLTFAGQAHCDLALQVAEGFDDGVVTYVSHHRALRIASVMVGVGGNLCSVMANMYVSTPLSSTRATSREGKGCIRFSAMVMGLIALLCFIGRRETGTARSSLRRLMQSVSNHDKRYMRVDGLHDVTMLRIPLLSFAFR